MRWTKTHHRSGATTYERHAGRCRLSATPKNWTNPKGPSNWTVTCEDPWDHKRGHAATMAGARKTALRVARELQRRADYR